MDISQLLKDYYTFAFQQISRGIHQMMGIICYTYYGHSCFGLKMSDHQVLIDPVMSSNYSGGLDSSFFKPVGYFKLKLPGIGERFTF